MTPADLSAAKVAGPAVAAAAKNGSKSVSKDATGAAFALALAPDPTTDPTREPTATFTLHSEPVVLGTAVVAADGSVALSAKVPAGVVAGAHAVVISGTGIDGEAAEASIALEIVAAGSSAEPIASAEPTTSTEPAASASSTAPAAEGAGDLANTGFGAFGFGIAGGLILLLGALVTAHSVRTRGTRH